MQKALFMSIPPKMKRVLRGTEVSQVYQKECINSWIDAGFSVSSLNNTSEIDTLSKIYPNVSFLPIQGLRPKIAEFITAVRTTDVPVAGIVNADCMFVGSGKDAGDLCEEARGSLVLLERMNIDPTNLRATGQSCYGFDAFIFDTDVVRNIRIDAQISIGETWWDYMFPLGYIEAGGQLKKSPSLLMLHLDHPLGWNDTQYQKAALRTFEMFHGVFPRESVPTFKGNEGDLDVGVFAMFCFNFILETASLVRLDHSHSVREQMMAGVRSSISDLAATMTRLEDRIRGHDSDRAATEERLKRGMFQARYDAEYREAQLCDALAGPANRPVGEFLCTIASQFRESETIGPAARAVYSFGADLQRRANIRRSAKRGS